MLQQLKQSVDTHATVVDGLEVGIGFVINILGECLLRAKHHRVSNGSWEVVVGGERGMREGGGRMGEEEEG